MLRKLRIKFVFVNMTIVTLMLGFIFGMLYLSTNNNMVRESIQAMGAIARQPWQMEELTGEKPEDLPEDLPEAEGRIWEPNAGEVRTPYLMMSLDINGEIININGDLSEEADESVIQTLRQLVEEDKKQEGELKEYGLRYFCNDNPKGCNIVFMDYSRERAILRGMIRNLILTGMLAFFGFLGLFVLLSYWVVKPVEEAWNQQKQFIADASHELKTPLTVILTDAELLNGTNCSELEREQLTNSISTMASQMKGLVESMLELARMDSGGVKKQKETLNFSEVVGNAAMIFEPVFFENDLLFSYEIEPDIQVHGNGMQIKQLVDILLDNAVKYATPRGSVLMTLERTQHKHCLFTVSNQGAQISEEEIGHLFERFYRIDKVRTRNQSYGLGLSIAQSIAEEHRGKIWAESRNGWNRFFIEFLCQ